MTITVTLLGTGSPLPDPNHGAGASIGASIEMSTNTTPFNITHHPAISVPCGTVGGLPVGIQLIGKHFDEATLFQVGQAIETL